MLVILAPSKQMRNREETIMVIRLFCAAGMSTSLLVKKMEEAAKEKGKDADIVIVDGNPFDVTGVIKRVLIDGKEVE